MNLSDTHSGEETRYDSVSVFHVAGYVVLLVTLGAVLSVAAAGAATEASTDGPVADGIVVDLDGEGNAVVTVTVSFDLTVEGEQSDFEAFAGNEAEQQAQLDQYESRLSNVAAEVESQTGREMTVTNASISTQTRDDGDRGLVVLQAAWKGLAANDGGRLVLGAPFDGGFNADRAVAVRPPEQHRVVSTAPEPTDQGEQLLWSDDQSLDEFEVVVEPLDGTADDPDDGGESTNPDGSDGTTDDEQTEAAGGDGSGPGFGIVVALLGIAGLRLLARRR